MRLALDKLALSGSLPDSRLTRISHASMKVTPSDGGGLPPVHRISARATVTLIDHYPSNARLIEHEDSNA